MNSFLLVENSLKSGFPVLTRVGLQLEEIVESSHISTEKTAGWLPGHALQADRYVQVGQRLQEEASRVKIQRAHVDESL